MLPLLGGYYFLHRFYLTKYRAQALQQYRLLFESALIGFLALTIARPIVLGFLAIPGAREFWPVHVWKGHLFPHPFSGSCVAAFALCVVVAHALNKRLSLGRAVEKAYEDYADELIRKIIRSQRGGQRGPLPLMITLKSRKVYIGIVRAAPRPDQEHQYLTLLPTASGYRNNDTLKLVITTLYEPVYEVLDAKTEENVSWDPDDFEVVIPLDRIESMTTFVETVPITAFDLERAGLDSS